MPESVPPHIPSRSVWRFGFPAVMAICLLPLIATAVPDARQETFPPLPRSVGADVDSLHYQVEAGEVLIFALPEVLEGVRYAIVRAPALSWLRDRSFFWRTLPEDAGEHVILFSVGRSEDTLSVRVSVR